MEHREEEQGAMPPEQHTPQPEEVMQHTPQMDKPQRSGMGPIIGIIIIVAILVFGALYFWGAQLTGRSADDLPLIPPDDSFGTSAATFPEASQSDEVSAIEADLANTDLDALEAQLNADLQALEAELESF